MDGGFGGGGGRQRNVLGGVLGMCSEDPVTGFYRTGCCETGPGDLGLHTVCVVMTEEFLAFSQAAGNDLSTPRPEYGFHGLKAGDQWCLCASRWKEAFEEGKAPQVVLASTNVITLQVVSLDDLKSKAIDWNKGDAS
jgi:uncharacterized protein (DUF2237 family)